MFFKPEAFEKAAFHLLSMWTENILKTDLFDNDGITIMITCDLPSRGCLKYKSKMTSDCSVRFQISSDGAWHNIIETRK